MKQRSLFTIILFSFVFFILFSFVFSVSGCDKNDTQSPNYKSVERTYKIRAELDRLNSWDKFAIDRYDNPLEDPTFLTSGETAGFSITRKSQLKELGVSVRWDRKKMQYVIVKKR